MPKGPGPLLEFAVEYFQRAYGLNGFEAQDHNTLSRELVQKTGCSERATWALFYGTSYAELLDEWRKQVPNLMPLPACEVAGKENPEAKGQKKRYRRKQIIWALQHCSRQAAVKKGVAVPIARRGSQLFIILPECVIEFPLAEMRALLEQADI